MKLFNTLTRQTEPIKPIDGHTYRLYSCGPTVYNQVHIGNLRSFIVADLLRRVLSGDHSVKHVMNYTDVDDKTISASLSLTRQKTAKQALLNLTSEYIDLFLLDMQAVGNDVDRIDFIKATDFINEMQSMINKLVSSDIAYIADDGIYFSIKAYQDRGKVYGQLSQVTSASTSEARIQNDEYDKDNVHDFALWKLQKDKEPAWDFTLKDANLRGRPGWHIECSAMSRALLGQPFDVHTGGVDLIFPHHENEIAQSTASSPDENLFAKAFVHNEHLLVDNQKMSKSLNNFFTLKNIKERGFDPLAFRLLILQTHYRRQAHFSWDNLQSAQNRLQGYRAVAALKWQTIELEGSSALPTISGSIRSSLEDDLDTPSALAKLNSWCDELSNRLVSKKDLVIFYEELQEIDDMLGLSLSLLPDIDEAQKRLLEARERAREQKDWQTADKLRDQLESQGIGLRDTQTKVIWFPL